MDKIGEYLPLIGLALYFAYSFLKGSKKKEEDSSVPKQQEMQNIPRKKPQPVFSSEPKIEDVFQRTKQQNTQVKKNKVEKKSQFAKPQMNEFYNPPVKRSVSDFVDTPFDEVENIDSGPSFSFDSSDMNEVKKGIIYSEIFNRKYE